MKNNYSLFSSYSIFLLCLMNLGIGHNVFAQNNSPIDAATIAAKHYNSIVKIIVIDSAAERLGSGKGYMGRGSGFLVSKDGLIFTNRHVIKYALGFVKYKDYDKSNKDFISVTDVIPPSGIDRSHFEVTKVGKADLVVQVFTAPNSDAYELYAAKIVSVDSINFDGAILQIVSDMKGNKQLPEFNPVRLGNSDSTKQGEDLCLYGFPAQYDGSIELMFLDQSTLTFGKHSGFDRVANPEYGFIKTDASINSGNSGGPVFNANGLVIGLSTAASHKTRMGFVAPVNGMFLIARKNPEVFERLQDAGLSRMNVATLDTHGIVANPMVRLPHPRQIKWSNIEAHHKRRFKGGFWYLKAHWQVNGSDAFQITDIPANMGWGFQAKQGENLMVNNLMGAQFDFGKAFTLWRFSENQKLSIDWTILNVQVNQLDWEKAEMFKDAIGTRYFYYRNFFIGVTPKIGLMYSVYLGGRNVFDAYYKAGVLLDGRFNESFALQTIEYTEAANQAYIAPEDNYLDLNSSDLTLNHTFGLQARWGRILLGFEYQLGKQKFDIDSFRFPTEEYYQDSYGKNAIFMNQMYDVIDIKRTYSLLQVSLGTTLGGNKRWKKFVE